MNFLRRLLQDPRVADDLLEIALEQSELIRVQRGLYEREAAQLQLEYVRWAENVLENVLIWLDDPDRCDRDLVAAALIDFKDHAARLSEHVA